MLYLYQTPNNRYRFYDDVSGKRNISTYISVYDAYRAFPRVAVYAPSPLPISTIASSPDYDSFPQLYPEFFI